MNDKDIWFRFEKCNEYDVKLIRLSCTPRRLINSDPTTWDSSTIEQGICIYTYTAILDYCATNYPDYTFIICPHDDDDGCQWTEGDNTDGNSNTKVSLTKDDIVNLWTYLADMFKGYDNVYFEIWNEPRNWDGDGSVGEWYDICKAVITAIRDTSAKNKILVPGINYTGVHNWMSNNASTFGNIGKDLEDVIGEWAFSMHQYYNSEGPYDGKSSGVDTALTPEMIDSWFNVDTDDSVSKWLHDNDYKAFLTETNILYDDTTLITSDSDHYSDWTTYFKPAMKLIYDSKVWDGVCAWTSVYTYNNEYGHGNILNSPNPEGSEWQAGWFSTCLLYTSDAADE